MEKIPLTIFIINARAGTVLRMGQERLRTLIQKAFEDRPHEVVFCEPQKIEDKVKALCSAKEETRIIIGGGDGTLMHLAPFFIAQNIAMGVLPMGTMNFYAKDVGYSPDLEEAITQNRDLEERIIDIGRVGEHLFLYCVSIGLIPEASKVREEMRDVPLVVTRMVMLKTLFQEVRALRRHSLKLRDPASGEEHKCKAVVISNNSLKGDGFGFTEGFRHHGFDDGILEANRTSPLSVGALIRICFSILIGKWKANPLIKSWQAPAFDIHAHKKKLLVAIDGETVELEMPLSFHVDPQALKVWVPANPF